MNAKYGSAKVLKLFPAYQWVRTHDGGIELRRVKDNSCAAIMLSDAAFILAPLTTNGKRSQEIKGGGMAEVEAHIVSVLDRAEAVTA